MSVGRRIPVELSLLLVFAWGAGEAVGSILTSCLEVDVIAAATAVGKSNATAGRADEDRRTHDVIPHPRRQHVEGIGLPGPATTGFGGSDAGSSSGASLLSGLLSDTVMSPDDDLTIWMCRDLPLFAPAPPGSDLLRPPQNAS